MFARHDLVWLSDQAWRHAWDAAPADCRGLIEMWRLADWPAIVRRADADLAPGQLSVGIALPPRRGEGGKTRIGLRAARSDVSKLLPPLPLAKINEAVPTAWRSSLTALNSEAAGLGLAIRVYGSVALQALTRQTYLTATSDIDVLLHPASVEQLHHGLDLLNAYSGSLPLDGEIVFPHGQAVAWKELSGALRASNGPRVLMKEMHRVYLASTSTLLATLRDDVCLSS